MSLQELGLGGDFEGNTKGALGWGNRLEGTLPPSWGSMASLRTLGAMVNMLTGPLPREWGALRLRNLFLSDNLLTGSLPDSWAPMMTETMRSFSLVGNRVGGTLPASW